MYCVTMRRGWQGLILQELLLLGALVASLDTDNTTTQQPEKKKFGDKCLLTSECFDKAFCNPTSLICQCMEDYPITNHIDKCGKKVKVNESCYFNEQCEALTQKTECRDGFCACRFERLPVQKPDGTTECIVPKEIVVPERYVDPAMIGILVAMFLMFITICVVLRLFSRARWRENRTIFNTPNPRLMNASLLRESKLLHGERRNSRGSIRGPSRQPSMASLRTHSPNSAGSRRGSRGSSNASGISTRSNKSPPAYEVATSNTDSVAVEIQDGKS